MSSPDRWADDPELVATFRAEVTDRLAALGAGLLTLAGHPAPKQAVAPLLRDAHTVKGSARMLGLDDVLALTHSAEDVLLAVSDRRLVATVAVVDVLLRTCDALGRALPGSTDPVPATERDTLLAGLRGLLGESPAAAPPPAPVVPAPRAAAAAPPRVADPVRVPAERIYELLDVVGEAGLGARRVGAEISTLTGQVAEAGRWAATVRDSLARSGVAVPPEADLALHRLVAGADAARRTAEGLDELVETGQARLVEVRDRGMGLAMVPLHRVVAAFPRLVRDVAAAGGKDVRLELAGEDTELDKKILDGVADALRHLVTNAVDHGCEAPEQRLAAGKPAQAVVRVSARTAGARVVVTVADDGDGVDAARVRDAAVAAGLLAPGAPADPGSVLPLLFAPALSTAGRVTEHSGRGVGLDVVHRAVTGLGGDVVVDSVPGRGTTFTLTLPVTLGVVRCLVARVGSERYALPVAAVVESVSLRGTTRAGVAGGTLLVRDGVSTGLRDLGDALGTPGERTPGAAVVVETAAGRTAWAVDRLEGEREVVVSALGEFLGRPARAGRRHPRRRRLRAVPARPPRAHRRRPGGARAAPGVGPGAPAAGAGGRGLGGGPRARAGAAGEGRLRRRDRRRRVWTRWPAPAPPPSPPTCCSPTWRCPAWTVSPWSATVRALPGWADVAVVMMTSRDDDEARRQGLAAGADAYLLKGEFAADDLVGTVRRLVG